MSTLRDKWLQRIVTEWLLLASAIGFAITSFYLKRLPSISIAELQILFILLSLFITIKGLERSGLLARLSSYIGKGKFIALKLVAATFFLSMLITNDVALMVIVPLTLMFNSQRRDILVILEALAANAGSALTPLGNPQNLFIYWFYNISPETFFVSIAPFCTAFLAVLLPASAFIRISAASSPTTARISYSACIYCVFLLAVILTVLRVLPVSIGLIAILYALIFDRLSLRVDYALVLTILCFFGLSENLKQIVASRIEHSGHVFILSALSSQVISNVPSTLLFAKVTAQWKALLWGVNVGGFGSPIGSLANLIAYKLYVAHEHSNHPASFIAKFLLLGYAAYFIGIGLYFSMIAN